MLVKGLATCLPVGRVKELTSFFTKRKKALREMLKKVKRLKS
jgi:hypothetical protein